MICHDGTSLQCSRTVTLSERAGSPSEGWMGLTRPLLKGRDSCEIKKAQFIMTHLSYVHAGDPGKVKGLEGHLSGRFTDRLATECAHSCSGLNEGALVLLLDPHQEETQLGARQALRLRLHPGTATPAAGLQSTVRRRSHSRQHLLLEEGSTPTTTTNGRSP